MALSKIGGCYVLAVLTAGAGFALFGNDDEAPASSDMQTAAHAPQTTGDFMRPVDGPIGTPYHQNGSSWQSGYHTGMDFVVNTGTVIHAAGSGTVISAGWGGSYGNQVVIKHAGGIYTQYAHLSRITIHAGQHVTEGQQIGLSGATGNATGPHLHFEVRTGPDYGSDIDPLAYLRKHGAN